MRQRQSRRNLAGKRQPLQQHAEHEQQDQSPEEFRDRQQHDRGEVRHRFGQRAAQTEQNEAAAEAEDRRDRHGAGGKLDRRRQRGGDQRTGVAAQRNGAAEVAVQRVGKPYQILLRQRLIEAHLATLGLDFLDRRVRRQRHRRRINRQQPQDAEQERRHDQQDRDRRNEAAREQFEDGGGHFAAPIL